MARTKETWAARLFSYGLLLITGEHAPRYTVRIAMMLERDPERMVDLVFADPAEARSLGESLIAYAARVDSLNASVSPGEKA